MRRNPAFAAASEDEQAIDLTPMLDVVFIMLIFFIVTASFIKEAGIDVSKKDEILNLMNRNKAQGMNFKLSDADRELLLTYMF